MLRRSMFMNKLENLDASEEILEAVRDYINDIENEVRDIMDNLDHRNCSFTFNCIDEAFNGAEILCNNLY